MVTRRQLEAMARRHDTVVGLAFRRALGIGPGGPSQARARGRIQRRYSPTHRELDECRRQRRGVDQDAGDG